MAVIQVTDEWNDLDLVWHRDNLATQYLTGRGIEIGALHKPTKVADNTVVKYVDYKTKEQNLSCYPELEKYHIVDTDIVDDGFILSGIEPESQDFTIANHVLEHSPDPIGTLKNWLSKLRRHGSLFISVPIGERCFDAGRPLTSLEHLIADHLLFSKNKVEDLIEIAKQHLEEFIKISGYNIRKKAGRPPAEPDEIKRCVNTIISNFSQQLHQAEGDYEKMIEAHVKYINFKYDMHYHTFSPTSFLRLLNYFAAEMNCTVEMAAKSGGGEVIGILHKHN